MNNPSNERLKEISDLGSPECMTFPPSHDQCAAMARELLAYREAQGKPVGYTWDRGIGCEIVAADLNPDCPSGINLYAAPQLPSFKEAAETKWLANEAECVAMRLDDAGIPLKEGDNELSLWGRVTRYAESRSATQTTVEASAPVITTGWTDNDLANSALVMLDRIDTLDSGDDDRIEEIKRIVRHLAAIPETTAEPSHDTTTQQFESLRK